jgi:hypothetical protein
MPALKLPAGNLGIFIFIYAIILHLVWAVCLFFDPGTVNATAVAGTLSVFRSITLLNGVIFLAPIVGLIGLFLPMPMSVLLLSPQQTLLQMSAASALGAMVTSQFADGVVRSSGFIIADQIHIVLAALAHAAAIITLGISGQRQ